MKKILNKNHKGNGGKQISWRESLTKRFWTRWIEENKWPWTEELIISAGYISFIIKNNLPARNNNNGNKKEYASIKKIDHILLYKFLFTIEI